MIRGMQSNDQPGWGNLAAAIKAGRHRAGFAKRAPFARELGIDDSTLAIVEGARPGTVSEEMLDTVTARFDWPPGRWRAYIADEAPDDLERAYLSGVSDEGILAEVARRMRPERAEGTG